MGLRPEWKMGKVVQEFRRSSKQLPEKNRSQDGIVFFTVDPWNDSQSIIYIRNKFYIKSHNIF